MLIPTNDHRYTRDPLIQAAAVLWHSMHSRCKPAHVAKRPTYATCSVVPEWYLFSNFLLWYRDNHIQGCHLDKDILVRGNKVYGPEFCAFVPNSINNLINLRDFTLPVYRHGRKYRYQLGVGGTVRKVSFNTREECVAAYISAKEERVREAALEAFLANQIKSDVYLALKRWKVLDDRVQLRP